MAVLAPPDVVAQVAARGSYEALSASVAPFCQRMGRYYAGVMPFLEFMARCVDAIEQRQAAGQLKPPFIFSSQSQRFVPEFPPRLIQPTDSPAYVAQLQALVVALPRMRIPAFADLGRSRWTQEELVHQAIQTLMDANNSDARRHVLTQGYRRYTPTCQTPLIGTKDLEYSFTNSQAELLKSPIWSALRQRIGDRYMSFLLTQTAMYLCYPNQCALQLTGVPLAMWAAEHTQRRAAAIATRHRCPTRHGATSATPASAPHGLCEIAGERLPRSHMFYSRVRRTAQGKPDTRLPRQHELMIAAAAAATKTTAASSREAARDLLNHVFPWLTPPDPTIAPAEGLSWRRYRHLMTPLPVRRLRWRMRRFGRVLERMVRNHTRLPYQALLEAHCPPPLVPRAAAGEKPPLMAGQTPLYRVQRFLVDVLRRLLPRALLGSAHNWRTFESHVRTFLALNRHESFPVSRLLQGMRLTEWQLLHRDSPRSFRPGPRGHIPRMSGSHEAHTSLQRIVGYVLRYCFTRILIPLVRAHFYVTDSAAAHTGQRVYYFRHDVWQRLLKPHITRTIKQRYRPLTATEVADFRQRMASCVRWKACEARGPAQARPALGYPQLRFLPKVCGVRPIVNLRRRRRLVLPDGTVKPLASINELLDPCAQVLKAVAEEEPSAMGAAVTSRDAIRIALAEYQARLRRAQRHRSPAGPSHARPAFYVIKVDMNACYDNIDQNVLMAILRRLIKHDEYFVRRYCEYNINAVAGPANIALFPGATYTAHASSAGRLTPFERIVAERAERKRGTVFTEGAWHHFYESPPVLAHLASHVSDFIVSVEGVLCRQQTGIPQGSKLSSLLCALFFGDLEAALLSEFVSSGRQADPGAPQSLMMRYVDDLLFITEDSAQAAAFLQRVRQGFPAYRASVNHDKTELNFEVDSGGAVSAPRAGGIRWCGLWIDTQTLNVHAHDPYDAQPFCLRRERAALGLNVALATPGARHLNSFMLFMRSLAHTVFFDRSLNSPATVRRNVMRQAMTLTVRFYAYATRLWRLSSPSSAALARVETTDIRPARRGFEDVRAARLVHQLRRLIHVFADCVAQRGQRYRRHLVTCRTTKRRLARAAASETQGDDGDDESDESGESDEKDEDDTFSYDAWDDWALDSAGCEGEGDDDDESEDKNGPRGAMQNAWLRRRAAAHGVAQVWITRREIVRIAYRAAHHALATASQPEWRHIAHWAQDQARRSHRHRCSVTRAPYPHTTD